MFRATEFFYKLGLIVSPAKRMHLLSSLGYLHERNGDLEKAEAYYREACMLDPEDSSCYYDLAAIYEKQNKISLAIENYEKALNRGAGFSEGFRNELLYKINKLRFPY